MPTLTINGRQVSVDDSFLNLPREEQDATVEEIAKSMPAQEPSGALAGLKHGVAQVAHGVAETAKQNFGVGDGFDKRDPNYVPADPYKPSQWGQLIAENLPSWGGAIAGGKAAASMAPGKWKVPAALLGAAGAGWLMSSGDTINERAANNKHETPTTEDKIIGNLTAGAGAAASAVPVARLVPGLNKVAGAGGQAAASAVTKALTNVGAGIAGNTASDLATQVGTTAGTEQGLTVDPSRLGGAAITGGVVSGAHSVPGLSGDLVRAGTLRKYVGENEAASKNYATRLETAGNGGLGNAKVDEGAHQRVVADLKSELGASAANVDKQTTLSQEAKNSLSALQRGEKVNPDEIARIEREVSGAPDGANTALLARTLHVADMAGERGGHSNGKWSGGISGAFDRNVGYMLNPFRSVTGALATGAGVHLLGTSSPQFAAAAFGTYGASRVIDNLTGMRSPAKTFAEHFADRNAQLRVPPSTPAAPAAPPPPGGGAQGPWGPKPLPQQSVPQAGVQSAPPQAPQVPLTPGTLPWKAPQVTQLPNISPIALNNLQQTLKAGLPAAPSAEPAAPPPAPQIDPLNLPTSITKTAKNLMGGHAKVQEIREKEQARSAVAGLQSPLVEDAPLDVTQNPMVGKRASQLVSAANALRKYTGADVAEREQAQAEAQAAREEKAAAKEEKRAQRDAERKAEKEKTATERAQAMAQRAQVKAEAAAAKAEQVKQKEAAKVELAKAKIEAKAATDKVKAAAAKVKAPKAAPEAPAEADVSYEPFSEEHLYPKGISPQEYARLEASRKGTDNDVYIARAEASEQKRQGIAQSLKAKFPKEAHIIDWLQRELQRVGTNPAQITRAVKYAQDNVNDAGLMKALDAFK
jgi:hypothetical protein